MIIWNTIASTLGFGSDLGARLQKLCSADLRELNRKETEEFALELKNSKSKRVLSDFYNGLTHGKRTASSSSLKFIMLMFRLQKHPVVQQWIVSHKMNLQVDDSSRNQSANGGDLLDSCTREICRRLEYYLARKIKTACNEDEHEMPLHQQIFELSRAYKLANDLDYLCELKELFHKLFNRYSEIGLIEECFSLTLTEANYLYEEFKGSFNAYFSHLDQENLEVRYSEICEVLETNRKAHRKLRHLYCTSDGLAGERTTTASRLQLSRLVEPPPYLQKWLAHTRRLNKLASGDLMKSTLINNSSVMMRKPQQSLVADRHSDASDESRD